MSRNNRKKLPSEMTPDDQAEWNHTYDNRIGDLTQGRREPTPLEHQMAIKEADERIEQLKKV